MVSRSKALVVALCFCISSSLWPRVDAFTVNTFCSTKLGASTCHDGCYQPVLTHRQVKSSHAYSSSLLFRLSAKSSKEEKTSAADQNTNEYSSSWLVSLSLPLWLIYVSNQWSRSSIYYLVDFSEDADPFKAMNLDIGFSQAQYGILASVAFTSLFAVASLGAGVASDRVNRKTLSLAAAATWSLATLGTALSDSYPQVVACRIIMGLACAFATPTAYPLIRERAPPDQAALATSLYGTGVAVASALSSLSILLDGALGWRNAYSLVGGFGLIAASTAAILLEDDPKEQSTIVEANKDDTGASGAFEEIRKDVQDVFSTSRVRWLLTGSLFRFSSGLMIGVWSGPYFRMAFADSQSEYAVAQAAISAIGASLSGILGGALADRIASNEDSDSKDDPVGRRLWVVVAASILAAPTWFLAVQNGQSFETAMAWLAAEYFVAECWFGPTISSLQATVGPKIGGTAQGIFTVSGALANFAPSILGLVYGRALEGTDVGGGTLSTFLAAAVSSCYLISAACFAVAAQSTPNSNDRA